MKNLLLLLVLTQARLPGMPRQTPLQERFLWHGCPCRHPKNKRERHLLDVWKRAWVVRQNRRFHLDSR
jgi:hypothetical protein